MVTAEKEFNARIKKLQSQLEESSEESESKVKDAQMDLELAKVEWDALSKAYETKVAKLTEQLSALEKANVAQPSTPSKSAADTPTKLSFADLKTDMMEVKSPPPLIKKSQRFKTMTSPSVMSPQ
jgi:uncharacterized protein